MKYSLFAAATLFSSLSIAATTTTAVVSKTSSNFNILRFSVNNQSVRDDAIQTNSILVPAEGKIVAAGDSVQFDIESPETEGIQKIRYSNDRFGCDFYLDTVVSGYDSDDHVYYHTEITAIPTNGQSLCNIYTVGRINHLSVGSVVW